MITFAPCAARCTAVGLRTSACKSSTRGPNPFKRSRLPVDRSSITRTWQPAVTRARATCEPMKPAPPVTRTRVPCLSIVVPLLVGDRRFAERYCDERAERGLTGAAAEEDRLGGVEEDLE